VGDSGNIKIIQTMASGGTAVLYKAVQTSLDRIVAVKRLHQHLTSDENFTRRFILEAKAAASLDHENIVHVIDFGRGEDGYEIIMEFVEGESFKEILERWRPIKWDLALAVIYQICQGLEHAHAKGIVHRDIKPGNVMLTKYGRVKITDFGLAKLTEAASSFTADNSIIGTPLYMSPEQAFGESVDQRSDLFSLGTMLYELITGRQPFASENYMGVIQNIINKEIASVGELNPDIPPEVEAIVMRALNKDREQRFQTARQLRKAIEDMVGIVELNRLSDKLKGLLEHNSATQVLPRPVPERPVTAAKKRTGSGRGALAGVFAVVIVAAAAVVIFRPDLLTRISGPTPETSTASTIQRSEAVLTPVDGNFDVGAILDDGHATTRPPESTSAAVPPAAGAPASSSAAPTPAAEPPATTPAPQPAGTRESAPTPPSTPASQSEPEPVVRLGYLLVSASPGAEVYVDGTYRGDSPPDLRLELAAGPHRLECRRPQHESYTESLRITAGEMSRRTVVLKKLKGILSLTTQEGAEVYIDGKLVGVTPIARPIAVDAGNHMVTIKKQGYNLWSSEVTIQSKQTLPLNIMLTRRY